MNQELGFLYVEDDPFSRQVMRLLLQRSLGYQRVTIFEDSSDFLHRLSQMTYVPDVVFLDIHMHPVDGFALLHILRDQATYQHATIIALTASVMSEEIKNLKEAGFDGAIAKPIDQSSFPHLLKRILQGERVWHIA